MGLYNAKLEDVVKLVNRWNHEYTLGLEFRGASDGRAAWLIENCALTTIEIGEITRVELDDFSWRGATADAHAAATKLFRHLNAHFAEIDPREYPDEMERIANNTLARMKSRDDFDYAQILARADLDAEARTQIEARRNARDAQERERARRSQLTADAWLEEFFGAGAPRAETKQDAQPKKAPVLTLQRAQKKQAKLLPRRLRHGLTCNANAADVVAVLFGRVRGIRKMEIIGAQCAGEFQLQCETSLSINAPLDSDYVVFISLTMREIESMETGREELLYLLWDSEVAEIKIKQEQAGQCRAEFFIDENENQWTSHLTAIPKDVPFEREQDGDFNKDIGLPLLDGCWQAFKEEWVKHETAETNATAPAPTEQPTWRGNLDAKAMSEQVETLFDFIGEFFRGHFAVNLAPEPYWGVFQVELTGLPQKSLAAIIRIKKCVYDHGEYLSIDNEQHEIGRIELVTNTHASYDIKVLSQTSNERIKTLLRDLEQRITERFKNAAETRGESSKAASVPIATKEQTNEPTWRGNGEPPTPRDVTDELDKKILALVKDNPDLTDVNIGKQIGLTRQAVNARRKKLKAMGHKVR